MSVARYRAYGLGIASPIPLIGALPVGLAAGLEPDLRVEYDSNWPKVSPERVDGPYQQIGNTLLFTQTGCASYHITADRIRVAPYAAARELEVAQMLVATALPAALWCRGLVVMHAACAVLPTRQRAVALVGPSGIGKSTLLHQLFLRGAYIVGDDTCTLSLCGDSIVSRGLPASLALTATALGERAYLPVPLEKTMASAPLAALFLIDIVTCQVRESFRRLGSREKLEILLQNRHRPRIPRILQSEGKNLPDIVRIADKTIIYRWQRQQGATAISEDEFDFLQRAG